MEQTMRRCLLCAEPLLPDEYWQKMVELFERGEQMARAPREAIEFPDQHAV
jgi:hypothetical protein